MQSSWQASSMQVRQLSQSSWQTPSTQAWQVMHDTPGPQVFLHTPLSQTWLGVQSDTHPHVELSHDWQSPHVVSGPLHEPLMHC
jgi:hypothetical protein